MRPSSRASRIVARWLPNPFPINAIHVSAPKFVRQLDLGTIPGSSLRIHTRQAPLKGATAGEFMRIAQVAPLSESVPPKLYGGTERVVSYLTEELVSQGHDVTLFASGDSVTRAKLEAICPTACRLDKACRDPFSYHILMMERVLQKASEFDVLHFHIDYLH